MGVAEPPSDPGAYNSYPEVGPGIPGTVALIPGGVALVKDANTAIIANEMDGKVEEMSLSALSPYKYVDALGVT